MLRFRRSYLLICQFALSAAILLNVGRAASVKVVDQHYKDCCGVISCLIALKSLGFESSLESLGRECGWQEGKAVQLGAMERALNSCRGVECRAVQLNPQQLCEVLSDDQTVVILAIRKNSEDINHAVCAVSADTENSVVRLFDYPEMAQNKPLAEIADIWDGAALIVRPTAIYRAIAKFRLFCGPVFAGIILLGLLRTWRRQRAIPSRSVGV